MSSDAGDKFERVILKDGRYPPEAFEFLHNGLEFTARQQHGEREERESRHVTGEQLCLGMRDLALHLWGPLAKEVLGRWNISRTRDFGEMVFLLVDHDLMGKREEDSIEDFDDVYDFDEAFGSYEIKLDAADNEGGAQE